MKEKYQTIVLNARLQQKLRVARAGLICTGVMDLGQNNSQKEAINYAMEVIDDCIFGAEQFPGYKDPIWDEPIIKTTKEA